MSCVCACGCVGVVCCLSYAGPTEAMWPARSCRGRGWDVCSWALPSPTQVHVTSPSPPLPFMAPSTEASTPERKISRMSLRQVGRLARCLSPSCSRVAGTQQHQLCGTISSSGDKNCADASHSLAAISSGPSPSWVGRPTTLWRMHSLTLQERVPPGLRVGGSKGRQRMLGHAANIPLDTCSPSAACYCMDQPAHVLDASSHNAAKCAQLQ